MKVINVAICIIAITFIASCKKENGQPSIPIPNGDFESWTGDNRLQNWVTNSCPECVPPFETYIIQKDSINTCHGRYAAKFIYNSVYPARAENKFYVPGHPVSLSGYVKASVYGKDTVSIKIRLFKNETVADSGQWLGLSSIVFYKRITIPITHSAMQVDSAEITIIGGHNKVTYPNPSTVFWVDALTLQ